MAAFVVIVLALLVWGIVKSSNATGTVGAYTNVLRSGIPARGILLAVSNVALGSVGTGLFKLQQRQVTIDIEVPGQPPYVATVTALIPLNLVRDVLPGATVELRVDPKNPNNLAIVGPGVGFNSNTLMTQGQINQGAA
jgi:hypothetical protein